MERGLTDVKEFIIRRYRAKDEDNVLRIWYLTSLEAYPFILPQFWLEHIQIVKNEYLSQAEIYVIGKDNEIAGFISLMGNYVGALFIDSKYQKKGLGTVLLDYAEKLKNNLYVDVYKQNNIAMNFYKKYGFYEQREKLQIETGCMVTTMVLNRK
ncbi:MAG: GNAT family N-acetyltransferase [Eubacteriales bacterium]